MPRRLRHFKPDSIFHVGARGVDRQPIFLTDSDREFFVATMRENLRASNLRTVAWSLMPNHFHWGIAVTDQRFDRALHDTLTAHAVRFNRLHGRTGHLFEDRHWSSCCEDVDHVENMVAYIHLNAWRAKIVARPEGWKWSSYAEWTTMVSGTVDFDRIVELTGRDLESLRNGHADRIASELSAKPRGYDADALIDDTASILGLSGAALRSGRCSEEYRRAKRTLLQRAAVEGISIKDLAARLGCTSEALYIMRRKMTKESA